MGSWFLLDKVEVGIKAQVSIQVHEGVLGTDDDLHGGRKGTIFGLERNVVLQDLSRVSVESHLRTMGLREVNCLGEPGTELVVTLVNTPYTDVECVSNVEFTVMDDAGL